MRITQIETKKLFGIFDHTIAINTEDRITIIHGPNGFGKTSVLRLIHDILESSHLALRGLRFEAVKITFDNESYLTVTRHEKNAVKKNDREIVTLEFNYPPNEPFSVDSPALNIPVSKIDEFIHGLSRVSEELWQYQLTGEIYDLDQVLEQFGDELPTEILDWPAPEWLQEIRSSLDVHLIRANRLEVSNVAPRRLRRHPRKRQSYSVVGAYADELAERIRSVLATYAQLSQSLDRTFPRRLVQGGILTDLSMEQITARLIELERRRKDLTEAGLLDKEVGPEFDFSEEIDQSKIEVLGVFVDDVEKKLGVFDELFEKVKLFKRIINKFTFKSVEINKTAGIQFIADDGTSLKPRQLSSGEQHEVVLLYELLFKVRPDSLILIDEPELSLHVAWQEQFLEDLAQITSVSSFDVLLATHSPQIINNRWDLTVSLEAP